MEHTTQAAPYTVLSAGYDFVMEHVNYEAWADYISHLIDLHRPSPALIAELGCGTGSFAIELAALGYENILATDRSRAMLDVAKRKAEQAAASIRFDEIDFRRFELAPKADVLLLLYDGLNYLLNLDAISELLSSAYDAISDDGIFIFDQSTPSNSLKNERYFEDHGERSGFSYRRSSRYEPETRLHTTTLVIVAQGNRFQEVHLQRAYTVEEIRDRLLEAGFDIVAAYDGFSLDPPEQESERVHWVVSKKRKQANSLDQHND